MIGHLRATVIDCPDADALAHFYEKLLGLHRTKVQDDWIEVKRGDTMLAFQQVENYRAPQWPGQDHPQQFHLDVKVDDIDEAEVKVLELGATRLPSDGGDFRVYSDPAGHPFCLVFHPTAD